MKKTISEFISSEDKKDGKMSIIADDIGSTISSDVKPKDSLDFNSKKESKEIPGVKLERSKTIKINFNRSSKEELDRNRSKTINNEKKNIIETNSQCSNNNKNLNNIIIENEGTSKDLLDPNNETNVEPEPNINNQHKNIETETQTIVAKNNPPVNPYLYLYNNYTRVEKPQIILLIIISIIIIINIILVVVFTLTNIKAPKIECDPGFFIPDDDTTMKKCQKCSLEGCVKCNGTYDKNECTSCGYLQSIYQSNKIIRCVHTCEEGPEEKCLKCYNDKNECQSCNIGYNLVNGICKPDYFIKAVYQSRYQGESIDLVYSYSCVEHMIIDGVKVYPYSKSFWFDNVGEHIVYIKFTKLADIKTIFKNIIRLKSVTFSNFNEYQPILYFEEMFYGCTNLISVDLSKIFFIYTGNLKSMFEKCTNLKYVNFNLQKFIVFTFANNMFYNCGSLTSIDLSKLDVANTENFDNMFFGCTSLQTLYIKSFKLDKANSINSMFYNCVSLKYIDISSFKPAILQYMNYVFYNCKSLTSINLYNFYTSNVQEMGFLFYNCISLKRNDLSSFNTQNVNTMESMFENCNSLTSIAFGRNFITSKLKYMNNIFSNCHSLTSINLNYFNVTFVSNFDYMFYNCYKLNQISLSNFKPNITKSLIYMFSGCSSLTSISLSNFNSISTDLNVTGIFYNCPKLKNVDFSFFKSSINYRIFNGNISSSGSIKLSYKYYNTISSINKTYNIPSGWTYNI